MAKLQGTVLATALLLGGCTMAPKYERPRAPIPPAYPVAAGVTDTNSSGASVAWRDLIGDARLKALTELSLNNNRDLRVAMLNVEKSRAQYRIARSGLMPAIEAGGAYTRARAAGVTSDTWSATIGATAYELDLWGRVRSLNSQALENYLATDEARRSVGIALVAEVATQYFALREAEEELELGRRTLQAVTESYDLNKASFDAGAIGELDVRTAEAQVQTAKIELLEQERLRVVAENALVLLAGVALPGDLPASRPFQDGDLVGQLAPGLPSELLCSRPDILAAEHALKAANANIGAARAAFFPSIRLTGQVGTASDEFHKLFGAGTGIWSFSPQVTLPIFTGGQKRADLESSKVGQRIEVARYEKAIQTAFREVSDAMAGVSSYASQMTARNALVTAQQARYDLATARYRRGEDNYLTVLSAQQDLYSAQKGLLRTQFNKLASQISLYKALGGGWK